MRLIDADAAINVVEFECGEWRGLARTIVKAIEQLPSAQPETGKWDSLGGIMDVGDGEEIQCNKCKATYMIVYRDGDYNFCPNCGARMVAE